VKHMHLASTHVDRKAATKHAQDEGIIHVR
jgi:hypothetical protein